MLTRFPDGLRRPSRPGKTIGLIGLLVLIPFFTPLISREVAVTETATTQFGFTREFGYGVAGLATFKHDVDEMAAHGQKWVRAGIASWDAQSGGSGTKINWTESTFRYLDQEIDYVLQKGMRLFLVTAEMPGWAESSPLRSYKMSAAAYCAYIANRYKGKISVWQIFNETNMEDFKTHGPAVLNSAYLREERGVLAYLRRTIKTIDPSIAITTNSGGFHLNDALQEHYFIFFDGIQDQLDMITLDLYPGTDLDQIDVLADRVTTARRRYGKPVSVGEIGLQTCTGCWGGDPFARQRETLVASMARLKQGRAAVVLVYEYRDWGNDPSDGEQNFGIVEYDGSHKPAYDALMTAMR
jgi:hypothetical protein